MRYVADTVTVFDENLPLVPARPAELGQVILNLIVNAAHAIREFVEGGTNDTGTGQGLAIARSVVVDKHDGTISLDNETAEGTTFIIRLPLKQASAAKAEAVA